jgi:energy-coupling factor transporter ATP-binding protein EcfA2
VEVLAGRELHDVKKISPRMRHSRTACCNMCLCFCVCLVCVLQLLDEPTNHLDMQSIDALAKALNAFDGGVVLVSHDFRLIQQAATEVWVVDDKKVSVWKGSIRDYKKLLIKQMHAQEEEMLAAMKKMAV